MNMHPHEQPFVGEGPQPLVRPVPPGAAYPVEALGPLREAVDAVQGMTQAPPALPAQSALAVASLAVQGFADVETLGGFAPPSLFCLTVAQSGERKSTCDALLMGSLRAFEREQVSNHRLDRSSWQNRHALWKVSYDAILRESGKAKGENKVASAADLDALGPEPTAPPSPDRTVTEPTFEGLTRLFAEGQPSLGLFSDEGGQFIGGHAMNADNRLKTVAALNGLWDGSPIRRTRAGEGAITLHGRRLAVHLMGQPEAVHPLLADRTASGTGFLARFLVTEPPSTIGTRLSSRMRRDDAALERFGRRLREILDTAMPMDPDSRELQPRRLPLGREARELLVAYDDTVEREQRPGGSLAHVTAFASKSAQQAARLAAVLTLWDDLHALEVPIWAMEHGIALARFYLREAVRLADAATISTETAQAEALRGWILGHWPEHAHRHERDPRTILPTDVVQYGPNALREGKVAKRLLTLLEEFGWLERLEAGEVVDGVARKLAYRIVRG